MYNLLMDSNIGLWDKGGATVDLTRYLEHTSKKLKEELGTLDDATIVKLKSWPALFAYELPVSRSPEQPFARVGRITDIDVRGSQARIKFEFDQDVKPLPAALLRALAWDLDIESTFNRTHWAVKDVDLMNVLDKASHLAAGPAAVSVPNLPFTSESVDRALRDAEHLITNGDGAASALDRVHTALHGYLLQLCANAQLLGAGERPSMTAAFKLLREGHPRMGYTGPRAAEVGAVMRAAAAIVEGLNTLRNNASNVHPNEEILPEPEAMCMVNLARTLLHYADAKIRV